MAISTSRSSNLNVVRIISVITTRSLLSRSTTSLDGEVNPTASSINPQDQSPDVVQPPQSRGEDVEPSDDEQPSACTTSRNGQVEVIRSFGQLEVAKLLIEDGADVNSRDAHGLTPLHIASACGKLHVIRLLLDHNADLHARQRNQRTALDLASYNGHLEVVELLLERGANANVWNSYGRTARQEASACGHGKIAELLSKHERRT
ncbi:ankyrin repeat-containing domain protein [Lactarius hatsudake]|nr:ankyrin repeat-containing domain protein [Lactarius hatsudake]